MHRLRIAILTTGRFHLLDLARELSAQGHDIAFHSCVSRDRCTAFGLPARCWRPLPPSCYALYWLGRRGGEGRWQRSLFRTLQWRYEWAVTRHVGACDVLIALSGLCPRANASLRRRHGARLWIERGSRHYLSQMRILATMPITVGQRRPTYADPADELADYTQADMIVVPSLHAMSSFVDEGVPVSKLFRNPYGVDLSMFAQTPKPTAGTSPTIIMAGRWSYRKGCDVLAEAWRGLPGVRLRHVGSIGDCPLPTEDGFEHFDAVQQTALREHYAQAHVMALASREEGLAVVQAQALSCGLRVVCSDRTGGEDLREFLPDPEVVSVVPSDNVTTLRQGLKRSLAAALDEPTGVRDRLGGAATELSWAAYGRRYSAALLAAMR